MIRALLLSTALAASAPAIAQQDMQQDMAPAPVPAQPAQPTQPTQPTAPADSGPADSTSAVAAIVDAEFPAYDGNGDGQLDQAEFTRWMVVLKDQEMKATGQALPPGQVTAWASGAFTTADTDKSKSVSKAELIRYLGGGGR